MVGFVFFDVETTGLRKPFDQIVHFAAIRTDADLNELERFEVRSRLLSHVVPNPAALLTNRLRISQLTDKDQLSHYEMVRQIRATLLRWSPAIVLGYNSIKFDEEMLRQAFYQTLHDPFLTSKHGNARMDVLNLAHAASANSPYCLTIPTGPEGRPTFKLEHLAAANGIQHDRAHDAMADVHATLHLCRQVRDAAPEVWSRAIRFSNKATVRDFVEAEDCFWLTEFFRNEATHAAVVCLGAHPTDVNARLCLNTSADIDGLRGCSDEELRELCRAKPSPIRSIRINAAPAIGALFEIPLELTVQFEADDAEARAREVKGDPALTSRLIAAYANAWPPREKPAFVEERIFDGFYGDEDSERTGWFHDRPWDDRPKLLDMFEDDRLPELAGRLIFHERRSALPEALRSQIERQFLVNLLGPGGTGFGLSEALSETERLLALAPSPILEEYRSYLVDRIERVTTYRQKVYPDLASAA